MLSCALKYMMREFIYSNAEANCCLNRTKSTDANPQAANIRVSWRSVFVNPFKLLVLGQGIILRSWIDINSESSSSVKKGIRSLEPALDEHNKDPLGYLGKAK